MGSKKYSPEFKEEAVRQITERGLHWRDCCPAVGVTGKTPTAAIDG